MPRFSKSCSATARLKPPRLVPQQYAESAQQAICTFPDSEIKRALLWAPEFVVAREK